MIPTDLASCIAWHQASYEAGADGDSPSFLFGAGGTSNGPTQATSGKRPVLATVSGKRVYTFDNVDDVMQTAGLGTSPHTVVVCFASQTTALGKRVVTNSGGGNWLIGPRNEVGGDFTVYNGAFIDSGVPVDTAFHVHATTLGAGNVSIYRIDGVQKGTNTRFPNVPGRVVIGGTDSGYATETANAHVVGIGVFDEALDPDTDLLEMEVHFNGSAFPSYPKRITQLASETAYEAGNIRETQTLVEVPFEAGVIRVSQLVVEPIVHGKPQYHVQVI